MPDYADGESFEELYEHGMEAFLELDYRKIMNLLNKMLEISKDDTQEYWTRTLFALSSLAFEGDELDLTEGRELANYALALSKKKENQKMELDAKELISAIEEKCGNWPALIENSDEVLLLAKELDDTDSIVACHLNLCKGYSMMKLFTKAKLHLDIGYSYVQSEPFRSFICDLTNIQYLLATGNNVSAEQLISTKEEILKIANNIASNDQVPFVVNDSQDIIRYLEKDMGTSLFSLDLEQPNDELNETIKKQSHQIIRLQGELAHVSQPKTEAEAKAEAEAVLRMNEVKARNPHLWSEEAKENRKREWVPYRVDVSSRPSRRNYANNTNMALESNLVKNTNPEFAVQKSNSRAVPLARAKTDWGFWTFLGAIIAFLIGGALSG